MEWLAENAGNIVIAVGAVLAALAAIAEVTPTQKDDKLVGKIQNIWNKVKGVLPSKKSK